MSSKKFGGFTPCEADVVIDGYRLIPTCGACPEQYEVFDDGTGEKVGYLHLRHGRFRAYVPDAADETVYEAYTKGKGEFDDDERMPQLEAAVRAIHRAISTRER